MRNLDFSSWSGLLSTILALALITLIGVGIRLVVMTTIQQRRERANRQINERLKVLIAAYKTLGGSFTGTLTVDPAHVRDLRRRAADTAGADTVDLSAAGLGSERARQIRDAVEAALSDIILLGTEEQVRLAERAARELVAGHPVHTTTSSSRSAISSARPSTSTRSRRTSPYRCRAPPDPASGGAGRGGAGREGREGGRGGGGGTGGGAAAAGGGLGMGIGLGGAAADDPDESRSETDGSPATGR